jgi:ribose transport system ATP-binding protein
LADQTPLLEMRDIRKGFPGVQALRGVSLSLRAGEVRALMGENGAGKSTLMNVLSGAFPDYEGEVLLEGRPVSPRSPREAQQLGIAMIHQELLLVPELSVADNIFLGRELRTPWGPRDRARMRREASRLLAGLDLTVPPERLVRQCRVAEQQLIEVAKALSTDARILIMDEPTSALADAEARRLFQVIRQLSRRGVAVVYISHRMEELREVAETVSVMRDGQMIGTRPLPEVSDAELIRMMVGRPLREFFARDAAAAPGEGRERLRVEHLSLRGDRAAGRQPLSDVSFTVAAGEIVGVAGLMGAGRTELLETIFGAHPSRLVSGRVLVDGRPLAPGSPARAIRRGLAFVTEDRKGQSLITELSIRFNIGLAALPSLSRLQMVDRRKERDRAGQMVRRLQIKLPGLDARVDNLSGGNQQKVVLGKWLMTSPGVILLDEPTRGIDVGAKAEVHALISELAAGGAAILMVSSELPELLAMSDRILVLGAGRLTGEFTRAGATQEAILEAAMPRTENVEAGVG